MRSTPQGAAASRVHAGSHTTGTGGRLLSNGRYSVLVTHAGNGASWCGDHALTRWTPDRVEDRSGLAIYVRDLATGAFTSAGRAPAGGAGETSTAWEPGVFLMERTWDGLEVRVEVAVVADTDAELRRVTVTNAGAVPRRVELVSAAEIVLHHPAADASHPAFSKLFVQTEFDAAHGALLARRRPRGNDETHPLLLHALPGVSGVTCESDRVRFLGRGGDHANPASFAPGACASGTTGNVLDPLASLRAPLELAPGASATRTFVLAAGADRASLLALAARFAAPASVEQAFVRAREQAAACLRECGVEPARAAGLQAIAAGMLQGHPALRGAEAGMLRVPAEGAELAPLGASLARPLVLVHPRAARDLPALANALGWWRALGVPVDAVALPGTAAAVPDGIRLLTPDEAGPEAVAMLSSAASLVLDLERLDDVAALMLADETRLAPSANGHGGRLAPAPVGRALDEPLRHFNGHGGFTEDGSEYVIRMPWEQGGPRRPPLPWVNVIATPEFGCIVSETGAGTTWSGNSREHRLTPWSNDPVLDPHGEALWLRDEDSGTWWSPIAGPAPLPAHHEMRHGFGYSVALHVADGLEQEVTFFVAMHAPVKVTRVRVTNRGTQPRRLSFWAYQRLVLGVLPEESGRFVVTRDDPERGLLTATNAAAGEFAGRVAFAAAVVPCEAPRQVSCDREAVLGLGGSAAHPLAPGLGTLDGRAGAGLDPCFAEKRTLTVAPGGTAEVSFLLGECADESAVNAVVEALREPGAVDAALEAARTHWRDLVSGIRIETPEPALDLMVNGWLAYQTLSCRIWGRTAFYQSGGAFGFRDQLQDACSLLHLRPDLAREQILLNAAHQFVEGDVLHWWHPPLSKGIRTRFADDLLWLPWLAAYYANATGDTSVFDETARYLEADVLAPGEDERFLVPRDSGRSGDVYEHCCRAIDRSLVRGAHGLPLFGTGDWNDGMNRVGREGRGESVWMGFFLHAILGDFVPVCERRGDHERAERYERFRDAMRTAVNDGGWDGAWYRRAYYDNGEPMGSVESDECRIDGLAQAWAVMSGAAPPERARSAMDAVLAQLVSEDEGLIRLLTPAFQDTPNDPGYIKGYVAGVRENGGQYTHAALWVVRAFAEMGCHDLAARLLAMLSPVSHTSDPATLATYRTEPYVIVADVYGESPHVGRGGWTWYSGSAGWMLRVAIESVLGLQLAHGETLRIRPCTPAHWPGFRVRYRVPGTRTVYGIEVLNPDGVAAGVASATLDGQPVAVQHGIAIVPVLRDGAHHVVRVTLGGSEAETPT